VRSKRTHKIGFATEIQSSKGSTWQVVDDTGNEIFHFTPEEFKLRFTIMGTAKSPSPDWMDVPKEKPATQGNLFKS
jgi:hypothetical protein